MDREIAETQLPARRTGVRPTGVFIGLAVLHTGDMRPAIVGTRLQYIDLVIGLRPVLGGIERAVRTEVNALHVPVAVGIDVADNSGKPGIVLWHGTIEIETQRFAHIGNVIPGI